MKLKILITVLILILAAGFAACSGVQMSAPTTTTTPSAMLCDTAKFYADNTGEGARVYNHSNQFIPDSKWTILSWDAAYWDSGNIFNNALATRLTVPSDGTYLIIAHIVWSLNPIGSRGVAIRVNGDAGWDDTLWIAHDTRDAVKDDDTSQIVVTTWPMKKGDFVEIFVRQTSGKPLPVVHDHFGSPEFTLQKVR